MGNVTFIRYLTCYDPVPTDSIVKKGAFVLTGQLRWGSLWRSSIEGHIRPVKRSGRALLKT